MERPRDSGGRIVTSITLEAGSDGMVMISLVEGMCNICKTKDYKGYADRQYSDGPTWIIRTKSLFHM